jgi:hypothetical protein
VYVSIYVNPSPFPPHRHTISQLIFNDDVTLLLLLGNFLDGDLECSDEQVSEVLVLTRLMMRESLVCCLLSLLADQPTNQTIFTMEQRNLKGQ